MKVIYLSVCYFMCAACIFNLVCWKRLQPIGRQPKSDTHRKTKTHHKLYQRLIEINDAEAREKRSVQVKKKNSQPANTVYMSMRINSPNTFELSWFLHGIRQTKCAQATSIMSVFKWKLARKDTRIERSKKESGESCNLKTPYIHLIEPFIEILKPTC